MEPDWRRVTGGGFTPRARAGRAWLSELNSPSRPPRLGRIWAGTLAVFGVMILVLGTVAVGSSLYQRTAFERTTAQLERELHASVALVRDLRTVDVAMGSIFYELGSPGELASHARTFKEQRRRIDADFARAEAIFDARGDDHPLTTAREQWTLAAAAVLDASELWGTGTVSKALADGRDPFAEEWSQLRSAQGDLTELTALSLNSLRASAGEAAGVQRTVVLIVLTTLATTLVLVGWSAHRLRRRLVAPVLTLRDGVLRMREGDLEAVVRVEGAGAELQELADSMNAMASSLQDSHGRLYQQAHTDALTGLPNRRAFARHINERLGAEPGADVTLLFLDIDDFKFVNDSYGHEAGDRLLKTLATRLRSSVDNGDFVARLGGDEFAIALSHDRQRAAGSTVAERVLANVGETVTVGRHRLRVGCSIGMAMSGTEAVTADTLLRRADMAMYMAKSGGKNRVEIYAETMHTELVTRMNLKSDLSHAVAGEQFDLEYQPIIHVETGSVLGWEALLRWQHPQRGLVAPSEFIPIAEETGDIAGIGRWVLNRACQDFAETLMAGRSDLFLTVNVAGVELLQDDFAASVRQTLRRHHINPTGLVLEITEAALVTETAAAAAVLGQLQNDGIRIAADDFGTGFSSLHRLQKLPVDIIKIDRSFVTANEPQSSTELLAAIVTLGRSLGLEMIAEGVEGPVELETLKRLSISAVQGYYLARPMRLADAVTHLRSTPAPPRAGLALPQGERHHVRARVPSCGGERTLL